MLTLAFPLALLIAVPLGALTVFAWRRGFAPLGPRRRSLLLPIRVLLLASLILSLAGAAWRRPAGRQQTVFVADLSASERGQQTAMLRAVNTAIKQSPPNAASSVVGVGESAVVEQAPQVRSPLVVFPVDVPTSGTNLQSGLLLASGLLRPDARRRIVLLTDGRQTIGDALGTARALRAAGIRLDVVPMGTRVPADAAVAHLALPAAIRAGEHFTLTAALRSSVAQLARVEVRRDGVLIRQTTIALQPGTNHWALPQGPLPARLSTYSVHIVPRHDAYRQNDTASAVIRVAGPPNILVIASRPREAADVTAALRAAGQTVTLRPPSRIPSLPSFSAVVLVDTAAPSLGYAQMQHLVRYVRNGGGLVTIGGQNAYGPGGYAGTPLETILPVNMSIRHQRKVPPVAVVLLIESLEVFSDIAISKQAAQGLVELLTSADKIAVNDTPDVSYGGWVVPLQRVRHKPAIERAIRRMVPGDPYSYLPYMQSGFRLLRHSGMKIKHMILVGDGDALDTYHPLITRMRRAGIIFSTIGTNDALGLGNYTVMRQMARWGGGVYYRARSSGDVPHLFLRELQSLRRNALMHGRVTPRVVVPSPLLRGLGALPPLDGYVQTTARPSAEVVLEGKRHDPILADWQVGLGRSVAWTSDAAGLWSAGWLRSPSASRIWANLVAWVLPPIGQPFPVATSAAGGTGTISAIIPASFGPAPRVTAHILTPTFRTRTAVLLPSSAHRYTTSFPAAQGVYHVALAVQGNGHARVIHTALVVPYPAEYRELGTDLPFLRALARAGGGRVLPRPTWADSLPAVTVAQPLTPILLLIALGLLLAELTVRFLIVGEQAGSFSSSDRPTIFSRALFPGDEKRGVDRLA